MLRFSNWMNECLEYLHTSPRAVPSDKILAAWVQLLHISEEIATAFSFDDLNKIVSIEEPKTQVMLKHFEKRLSTWRIDSEPRAMKGERKHSDTKDIHAYDFDQVPSQSCTTT